MPIPYEVTCSTCGDELKVSNRMMDYGGDLFIKVEPCGECMGDARLQGKEDAELGEGENS